MISKFVVLFAAVAFANAGLLDHSLRYEVPAIHAAPAISIAAPAISRVEHLAPAVASTYKTEVFTAPSARTYEISPAVTHVAAAPLVHAAPAPLIARAPLVHAAPAISIAAPAVSRIEHLAPAVASSYKTEVYTAPSARTYEISPAVTHVAPAPVVQVAPAPLIARAPLVHAAPAISIAAPAISRIEHLAPAVASTYKTEVLTAPSARTYEISPAVTHVAHAAPTVAIAAPAVHAAPLLRAAPLHFGLEGHLAHGYGHAKFL
ncbi:hypothetical protein FQR65_LT00508 [Abscondita terminalis]|nr:hypothetical protein FQR65_LT00508 [Abscondita terminalis]